MNWLETVLNQQYDLIRIIKQTENGSIIHYRHKELHRDIIKRSCQGSKDVYKVLQSVSHPTLPTVYEVIQESKNIIVLEEYIDGITVSDILYTGLYHEQGMLKLVINVCDALTVLHSLGIIHRDIKPENIMVTNDGNIKLIDFDASRIYKGLQSNDTTVIGTMGYAAPEQFGITQSDGRVDIFAIGVLMNVMLTGEHPSKKLYDGKLKRIIEKCLHVDPNQRYQSATELKSALLSYVHRTK